MSLPQSDMDMLGFPWQEDHYALLVKAWETKVFPTIRRRFRNEAERKSGLDQIKGALQLGKSTRSISLLNLAPISRPLC